MPNPHAPIVELSSQQRQQLEALSRAGSTPQALAFRCRIILHAATAENPSNGTIAEQMGCHRHTVGQWRQRFIDKGLPGLQDAPRCGRPRSVSPLQTA